MIPLRLILDLSFLGIALISFWMWAAFQEKYRRVKAERDAALKQLTEAGLIGFKFSDEPKIVISKWEFQLTNDKEEVKE